ncbi:MAG: hypothetical protein ACM3NO_07190 [Deltaproteobacteria bacterium]
MKKSLFALFVFVLAAIPVTGARATKDGERISCRAMEVFVSEPLGVTAVIFHQSDKADGPRLGELLLAHTGEQVEFETPDGKQHAATVERVKSCFGRGLLLFAAKEANLTPNQDFAVHFPAPK